MQSDVNKTHLFYDYYQQWIEVYKRGAIRDATMAKYLMILSILVDTFISKISLPMQPVPEIRSISGA